MLLSRKAGVAAVFGAMLAFGGGAASADSIDPETFSALVPLGDSVTVRKTVVIDDAPPTGAKVDIMFMFDTSGSMSGEINAAKAAAANILSELSGFGDVATGVGYYSDPGWDGVRSDLTTDAVAGAAAINSIFTGLGGGGGDFPELGNEAFKDAADEASWRDGSKRFIVALGDASFKNNRLGYSDADVQASLDAESISVLGLRYRALDFFDSDSDDTTFTESIEDFGGTVLSGSLDLAEQIKDAIGTAFGTYSEVTVDDLGNGGSLFDVTAVCVSADDGVCNGAVAEGSYDRSVERTFEFDVTFTRTGDGDAAFDTFALVDGGIVATEKDRFPGTGGPAVIPLPATAWMLIAGLGGLAAVRRRKKSD